MDKLDAEMTLDASFDAAFPRLYERARDLARHIVGDLPTAEDIAADALVKALQHWRRVGGLPYREAWVLRVTTNLALDVGRRRARRAEDDAGDLDTIALADDAQELVVLRLTLVQALAHLPRRQREAMVLTYVVGLQPSEVAAAMGISVSSVGEHSRRALTRLRRVTDTTWSDRERPTLATEI